LGSGSYGNVYLVRDLHSNKKFAMKEYLNLFSDLLDSTRVLREVVMMRALSNLNDAFVRNK
jgi:serine/threonine protein kinase